MLKKFADLVTLMVHGAIWRIGDGRSIKIWSDKWIPNSLDNVIHWDHNPDIDLSQTVYDIICNTLKYNLSNNPLILLNQKR